MDQNYLAEIDRLQQENEELRGHNQGMQQGVSTMFASEENENLVRWQLDIKEELERIEHLLKKHVPKTDEQGNEYFDEPKKEDQLFNEWGVNEILNILNWYLCKNIILSNFSIEEVQIRCHQFGEELNDFVFNNYEKMGLDNKDKIKHYPMVIVNIINTVEAAYHRAMAGGERESLRTARSIVQSENLSRIGNMNPVMQQPKRQFLRPQTWFKT